MLFSAQGGDCLFNFDSLSDRISYVIQTSGLTKTAFAKKINVSQSLISMIASGAASPSDRTILDICREFRVDEVWLRTGAGEMHRPMSRREEIAAYMADILGGTRSDVEEAVIVAMSRLPSDYWPVAARFLDFLIEEYSRPRDP